MLWYRSGRAREGYRRAGLSSALGNLDLIRGGDPRRRRALSVDLARFRPLSKRPSDARVTAAEPSVSILTAIVSSSVVVVLHARNQGGTYC